MPHPPESIRVLDIAPLQWAREHPGFFFDNGTPSAQDLVEQLVAGARALGAKHVDVRQVGDWLLVGSGQDWFATARFQLPEALDALTPFPERGQNCTRPECLLAAFARDVLVHGPAGTTVVQGEVAEHDPVLQEMARGSWARALAFRGVSA